MIEEEIKADFYGHENEKFVTHTDWREIAQDFFDSNDDDRVMLKCLTRNYLLEDVLACFRVCEN